LIRIDAAWLASAPLDMRAGTDTALARVIAVFGAAHPHHAYIFANQRANRIKILVHDGVGVWLAAVDCTRASLSGLRRVAPTLQSNTHNCTPWCWGCLGNAWVRKVLLPSSESSAQPHTAGNWGSCQW